MEFLRVGISHNVSFAYRSGDADDTLDKIDRDDLNQNVAAYVTAAYVAAHIERNFGRLPIDANETTVTDLTGRPHYLVDKNYQPLPEVA